MHTHTHTQFHLQDMYSDKVPKFNKRLHIEEPFILNETSWQEKKTAVWKPVNCDFSNVCDMPAETSFHEKKEAKLSCLISPPSPLPLLLLYLHVEALSPHPSPLKGRSKRNSSSPHFGNAFLVCNPAGKNMTLYPPGRMFKVKIYPVQRRKVMW